MDTRSPYKLVWADLVENCCPGGADQDSSILSCVSGQLINGNTRFISTMFTGESITSSLRVTTFTLHIVTCCKWTKIVISAALGPCSWFGSSLALLSALIKITSVILLHDTEPRYHPTPNKEELRLLVTPDLWIKWVRLYLKQRNFLKLEHL